MERGLFVFKNNSLKNKTGFRWEFFLILAVLALTIYNILPTIFFYSKPLKENVSAKESVKITESIESRVNQLEEDAITFILSYSNHLAIKKPQIAFDPTSPETISVTFKSDADAIRFRNHIDRAGALIPFPPAQLSANSEMVEIAGPRTVILQRRIPIHFSEKSRSNYFAFSEKLDKQGVPTPLWQEIACDRLASVAQLLGGTSENGADLLVLSQIARSLPSTKGVKPTSDELITQTVASAQNLVTAAQTFGEKSPIMTKYLASFSQVNASSKKGLISNFLEAIKSSKEAVKLTLSNLKAEAAALAEKGEFLNSEMQTQLSQLATQEALLKRAETLVVTNSEKLAAGKKPWTKGEIEKLLKKQSSSTAPVTLAFDGRSPFFSKLTINWEDSTFALEITPEFLAFKAGLSDQPEGLALSDQADQFLFNAVASLGRQLGEELHPAGNFYKASLSKLAQSNSFLTLNLQEVAKEEINQTMKMLASRWMPKHRDFKRDLFPILTYTNYAKLPQEERKLGLISYAPVLSDSSPLKGFNTGSSYLILKGGDKIFQNAQRDASSEASTNLASDFNALVSLLQERGYYGIRAAQFNVDKEFASDFIFIKEAYFADLIKASREQFEALGSKRKAVLELGTNEQRLLQENRIDDAIHEEILKQKDDYIAAQLGTKGLSPIDVPKPSKSALWDNFKLSFKKYFRGDERKIVRWGLDLSGGKMLQIQLRDNNNRAISDEASIKQGINELYNRVNKMGVSEVSIREEGDLITLEFPGMQALSASELVKASSMHFHLVNEKFGQINPDLGVAVNRFLQEVWNRALVTGKKSPEEISKIAAQQLYGDSEEIENGLPRTEASRVLYKNGLRLARTGKSDSSSAFNQTLSKIAVLRGDGPTEWGGNTHPLMIVFNNFALEGSSLKDVHASFDQTSGNFLSFSVKDHTNYAGSNPQDDFSAWTSAFAKEKMDGSPYSHFSKGKGWRMAVILNGYVISAPHLDSALRDSARITGSFTQREVNGLEADLKAGSLKFTPHILSEKNISPDLGSHERTQAIATTICSILLVIASMVIYYRFGGVIASVAVIFNLLIIWAALQNIGATISLAGIAGIILTIGMAVDANVLVFERIREELNKMKTKQLAPAITIGYRKAFSAIVDSNITTIIAAIILLNFDSGPIKGFAVTLIIGIVSSMFTALFVTRTFFQYWVKRAKDPVLTMANWIKPTNFNFLKHARVAIFFSLLVFILGTGALVAKRATVFGMDFTGGFALNIELTAKEGGSYRESVEKALVKGGLSSQDFEVRELSPQNHIRLFLSKSLALPSGETQAYKEITNPKIGWVVNTLEKSGVAVAPSSLAHLDANWSDVSGQMSESMRNNAIIGLVLALFAILIYITIRFEFKYAISATLCIAHDLFFTVAAIGILYAMRVPVQIDLHTVAALMTIVGYSLNDTIIIFDRIREDAAKGSNKSFAEVITGSVNITLSRTLMTSITTLLVIIPLVMFGGNTIFGFSLVMGIGVLFGTLSSLFIAAPLLNYFHTLELKKEGKPKSIAHS